ncbi:carbon monoxide dehydrogenase subunit G [Aerophototrophica crusticola]|uniref:Carbon monoxide dehydrogenase subunit G n=1 Tax=Aerophototrophica crusticola TaxID=1709002 RepID=A0A858R696_9PROT|nr:carbon monoxide dehydrogenase subunit G [Rhodospirillaceae bacterium B3]
MDMTGEYRIAAPRDRVWAALNDPEVLRQCIPGCEELTKVSDTEYAAAAKVKVGPVAARFTGRVLITDLDPPAGYTITGEGQGGAAGFGKGGANVNLAEDGPDATILRYVADAQVGGKLAQLGSRLVQGTARKLADDFFARFANLVAPGSVAATDDETADEAATELLVEAAEEIESRPEVPSSGMPGFASVPLVARPELVANEGPDAPGDMARLAEPHHRLDEDDEVDSPPPLPERIRSGPGAFPEEPAAAPAGKGLGPVVWIGGLAAILLALILIFR